MSMKLAEHCKRLEIPIPEALIEMRFAFADQDHNDEIMGTITGIRTAAGNLHIEVSNRWFAGFQVVSICIEGGKGLHGGISATLWTNQKHPGEIQGAIVFIPR